MLRFLRTSSLLLAALLTSVASFGAQGAQRVTTALANVNGTVRVLANAQITVCSYDSAHPTNCTSPVTVYQDPALTVPYPSTTFRADGNGNYSYWAAPGNYVEQLCATGTTCRTQVITLASGNGGGTLPSVTEMFGGDGNGGALAMPEKGVTVSGSDALVAWDEDGGMSQFDARDAKYDGGILGPTPALAMQDLANDIVCWQSMTGLHANVKFPSGIFKIGTPANPILYLPDGATYEGVSGNFSGDATVFQSTYNHGIGLDIGKPNLTATCSDGNVHTNTLTGGKAIGIGQHGCATVSCSNPPGDTGSYPFGGPGQIGIKFELQHGYVALVGATANGDIGIENAGGDTIYGPEWANQNYEWFIFGINSPGQVYNPSTDTLHGNIVNDGLDAQFVGPFETYGWLQQPGAEYGHVAAVVWAGGNTYQGPIFSNRDEIGLIRPNGEANGRLIGGRIDGPMGEGILDLGNANSFTGMDNITSCSGFVSVTRGMIFGPYISSLGTGMTPGSYVVPSTGGGGTGATLTVVVASTGRASTVTVSDVGSGYTTAPTFTMTGTGGTPATIGALAYTHCDYIDDEGTFGANNYVNVHNDYQAFFGANRSTGVIWSASPGNTYDRGTTGSFEHIGGAAFIPKGRDQHRDLPDPFETSGGVLVQGPAVSFTGGNHFISGDTTATNWSGPFIVESVMQDLWITGGNCHTTLRVQDGWRTNSGHDISLCAPLTYHFIVYQDDTFGNAFIFQEQGDTVFEDYLQPGFNWLAANSILPTIDTQATLDVAGSVAVRPYPAMPSPTFTSAGGSSSFTYCWVVEVWDAGGKQTTPLACEAKTPVSPTSMNNLTINLAMPQNWTRYKIILNSTTDGTFTPGVWFDVTSSSGLPQPASCDFLGGCGAGYFLQPFTPTDTGTIATANLALNMTGTYNLSIDGVPVPASSNTLCVAGQEIKSCSAGYDYICVSEDHWERAAITCSTF